MFLYGYFLTILVRKCIIYTPNNTLCPKLSEYTVNTLNYNTCYILHPTVNFAIILDGNSTLWLLTLRLNQSIGVEQSAFKRIKLRSYPKLSLLAQWVRAWF